MSHQSVLGSCTPLADFHAPHEDHWKLLLRVVQVNGDNKLTLPIRELWCTSKTATDNPTFVLHKAGSFYNDDDDPELTLDEANNAITVEEHLLRSFKTQHLFLIAGTGEWYVTERLVTNPSIWKKVQTEDGQSCYALDDAKVHAWLVRDDREVLEIDSENNWDCVSCPSSDEKLSEDDQDVEDQEGGDRDGEDHDEGTQSGHARDGDAQDEDAQDGSGREGEAVVDEADGADQEEDTEEGGVPLTEA
jgi:hypothetical protein